jgi:ribonuclease Z
MKMPEKYNLPAIDDYLELKFPQFQIIGRSIAGVETVFAMPQFNLLFDVGRAPHFSSHQDVLALTHWHMDHAGGVAFYLGLRCLTSSKPAKIVVPQATYKKAKEYLEALVKVSDSQITYELLSAEEIIPIKNAMSLKSLPSSHCIDSTGYGVVEHKHRLKKEYEGLSAIELVKLKEQGKNVNEHYDELLLAFSGDSRVEFLDSEASSAQVLMMECSFFGDDSNKEKVHLYGHTHIQDWVEYAEKIESETVIMTHTSQRYTKKEVEAECLKKLPKSLTDRLVIFRRD